MMKRDTVERDGTSEKVRKTLRGRAEKACVRCRAKKRTCDGGSPCQRCKESHSACYFSDWHYTVPYPREYVEYLEEQQEQLSAGLLTMYRLLKESHIKTVPALPEKLQPQDLLTALRGMRLDHHGSSQVKFQHYVKVESPEHGKIVVHAQGLPSDAELRHHETRATFDQTPRSPTQPPVFIPDFGSSETPSNMNANRISTPVEAGFSSMPYHRSFEFAQAAHPQMLLNRLQTLPQDHAAGSAYSPSCGGGANIMRPEPWRQVSNTPTASSRHLSDHLSPQTTYEDSERAFGMDNGRSEELERQFAWACDAEPSYFGPGMVGHHDPSLGLDMESIEQRWRNRGDA